MWSGLGTLGGRFDTPEAAAGGRSAERDARLHEELIPSKLSRILHGMVDVHRVLRAMHVGEALGDEEHRAAEGMASRSSKKAVSHREGGKEATRARTRFYTLAAIKSRCGPPGGMAKRGWRADERMPAWPCLCLCDQASEAEPICPW
jgi:hypothetical protein